MRLTMVTTVDADLDGWAKAKGISAAAALIEVREYLRGCDPTPGQTYLALSELTITIDLGLSGIELD